MVKEFHRFLLYSIIGFINLFKKMRGDKVRKNETLLKFQFKLTKTNFYSTKKLFDIVYQ